jgi:hypothetical protein
MNTSIVVDTGVWVYGTCLLSSPLGASLLYAIKTGGYTLALPEVIKEEITKHTIKAGSEASDKICEQYRLIEMLMGSRDDYRVPSPDDFRNRVESRLTELDVPLREIPFTIEHARSALRRVLEETPPNGYKNQQFKDSAIWEALLDLANQEKVVFITEDKAFFEDKNPDRGLAANLKAEADATSHNIDVYFGLSAFLNTIVEKLPQLDNIEIANRIHEQLYDQLNREATDKGFTLARLTDAGISPYLTEQSGILAIDFELLYETAGVVPEDRTSPVPAIRHVEGNCSWNLDKHTVSDIQLTSQKLLTPGGEEIPGFRHVYIAAGSLTIGRRTHKYRLKEPVPLRREEEKIS